MDLFAYSNIDRLEEVAKKNNISVPRLRGYRLMSEEKDVSLEEIKEDLNSVEVEECEDLIMSIKKKKTYIKNGKVLWNKIHGKFRKNLKFAIKLKKKAIERQYQTFNKYVGRSDVMMIHARVGGDNWRYYDCHKTVATQPWFLEKVDDSFDCTYCDIYVKII